MGKRQKKYTDFETWTKNNAKGEIKAYTFLLSMVYMGQKL